MAHQLRVGINADYLVQTLGHTANALKDEFRRCGGNSLDPRSAWWAYNASGGTPGGAQTDWLDRSGAMTFDANGYCETALPANGVNAYAAVPQRLATLILTGTAGVRPTTSYVCLFDDPLGTATLLFSAAGGTATAVKTGAGRYTVELPQECTGLYISITSQPAAPNHIEYIRFVPAANEADDLDAEPFTDSFLERMEKFRRAGFRALNWQYVNESLQNFSGGSFTGGTWNNTTKRLTKTNAFSSNIYPAHMTGDQIYITGGTGFTAGWYTVVARHSASEIELDASYVIADTTDVSASVIGPTTWASAVPEDWISDGTARGCRLKLICQIANALVCDLWCHLPPAYSNAAVSSMGAYIDANLNPGLRCIVEDGNEHWNPSFGLWSLINGITGAEVGGLTQHNQKYGFRAAARLALFEAAFANPARVISAIMGQGPNDAVLTNALIGASGACDAIGWAMYAQLKSAGLTALRATMTSDQVFDLLDPDLALDEAEFQANFDNVAGFETTYSRDYEIMLYEWGQHFIATSGYTASAAEQHALFEPCQTHQRMRETYLRLMDRMKDAGRPVLAFHLSDVAPYSQTTAYFGLREFWNDDITVKEQAVIDGMEPDPMNNLLSPDAAARSARAGILPVINALRNQTERIVIIGVGDTGDLKGDSVLSTSVAGWSHGLCYGLRALGIPMVATSLCGPRDNDGSGSGFGYGFTNASRPSKGTLVALAFSDGAWVEAANTLVKVGAFAGYTHAAGNKIYISGGTGFTPGWYTVNSKDSNDQITLENLAFPDAIDIAATNIGPIGDQELDSAGAVTYANAPALWTALTDGLTIANGFQTLRPWFRKTPLTVNATSYGIHLHGTDSHASSSLYEDPCALPIDQELRVHYIHGIDSGGGSFMVEARTFAGTAINMDGSAFETVDCTTGTQLGNVPEMGVTSFALAAVASNVRDITVMSARRSQAITTGTSGIALFGMCVENPAATWGYSYHQLVSLKDGTMSLYDMAVAVDAVYASQYLNGYMAFMRTLATGAPKKIVVRICSGFNDRTEAQPSFVNGYTGDSTAAYKDNLTAIRTAIEASHQLAGGSIDELYWVVEPSHQISDPDDAELITYRVAAAEWCLANPRSFCLDIMNYIDFSMLKNLWGSGQTDALHFRREGYELLGVLKAAALTGLLDGSSGSRSPRWRI